MGRRSRPKATDLDVRASGTGTAVAAGPGATANTGVLVQQVIDDALRKEITNTADRLVVVERLVRQWRERETDLLGQLAEATRQRDELREALARTQGQLAEAREQAWRLQRGVTEQLAGLARERGETDQRGLADRVAALTRECGQAERRVEEVGTELAAVRGRLRQSLEERDTLRSRRVALGGAGAYVTELARRDRTLARDLGVLLLAMAVGAIVAAGVAGYAVARFDLVAAPLAAAVIVGEALYRGRWTGASTVMVPTLIASWLAITTGRSSEGDGVSDGDMTVLLTVGPSLVVLAVVVADWLRQGRSAVQALGSRAQRTAFRVVGAVAVCMPIATVLMAFNGGGGYGAWLYAPFLIAFMGVVARSTWEPDLRARRVGAAAALVYAVVEVVAAVNQLVPGVTVPYAGSPPGSSVDRGDVVTALVLVGVVALAAVGTLAMTIDWRRR